MKVSKRITRIEPSLTRKMFNLAQNYDDVIDLTLGDPDMAPPEELRRAACRAMEENRLHYSANAGQYCYNSGRHGGALSVALLPDRRRG